MGDNGQILSQLNAAFANLSFGKKLTLATLIIGSVAGFFLLMSFRSNQILLYSDIV